jgi:DNA-binding response OmpR family regulator
MKMIMVVDDEEMTRALITKLFKKEGYEVIAMPNGANAMDAIQEITPDVVIMDLMMPDIDGYELACEMRRCEYFPADIPIVLMSGFPQEYFCEDSGCRVIDAFVNKPFDVIELAMTVKRLLNVGGRIAGEVRMAEHVAAAGI